MTYRKNGREEVLEQCQININYQCKEFQVILSKKFT